MRLPPTYESERCYVLLLLLGEFLGLDFQTQITDRRNVSITLDDNRELIVKDGLFALAEDEWMKPVSLPRQPLLTWDVDEVWPSPVSLEREIPVIYGQDPLGPDFFQARDDFVSLGLDIFGSVFFMLTRYEEAVKSERDEFERFPASASLAWQEGFLNRPIVNEYTEILWICMKRLWPRLERKPRDKRIWITHDVDHPFRYAFMSLSSLVNLMGAEVLTNGNARQSLEQFKCWFKVRCGDNLSDPYYSFDWLMDQCDAAGQKAMFFFLPETSSRFDPDYDIAAPRTVQLIRHIHDRGHAIGYHGSYESWNDPAAVARQVSCLREALEGLGIRQEELGSRQHYLRWSVHDTWRALDAAGIQYDSTLGFPETPGFRCGTGDEFPVFDLSSRKQLTMTERPMVFMDCSLGKPYMEGVDTETSFRIAETILDKRHLTDLTFNFHNNYIFSNDISNLDFRELYKYVLNA